MHKADEYLKLPSKSRDPEVTQEAHYISATLQFGCDLVETLQDPQIATLLSHNIVTSYLHINLNVVTMV